jgi:hypothetical protein
MSGPDIVGVDLNGLLGKLILFDTVILKSARLKEIPFLVRALGFEGTMELLTSRALNIYCEAITLIEDVRVNECRQLPIGQYNFGRVDIADHRKYIHDGLQRIHGIERLTLKQVQKLKRAVAARLVRPEPNFGEKMTDQFDRDLRSGSPVIHRAVALALRERAGTVVPDFSFKLNEVRDRVFQAETNLFELAPLSREDTNQLIQSGLAAIGKLNHRLAEMASVSALSGFSEKEIVLFEDKLEFLARAFNPSVPEAQFRRVLDLAGFPEFRVGEGSGVNIARLLEVRQTRECAEFRDWVATIETASDAGIRERIRSVRSRLASFIHSSKGKTARLLACAGIGAVPFVGAAAGLSAGFADSFLVDRLLPESGVVSFISRLYPSVFESP